MARGLTLGVMKTAKLRLQENFISIPTSIIMDQFAFSFADSGWHFWLDGCWEFTAAISSQVPPAGSG